MSAPRIVLLLCLALPACRVSMSPVQNKIGAGTEPFAVFVADGEASTGDLFAVPADGREVVQLTYTRVREMGPALSPDGVAVAFIRETTPGTPVTRHIVVLNLLNGAERTLRTPEPPEQVAWGASGQILVRTATGVWEMDPPPAKSAAQRLTGADSVKADSSFQVLLGTPAFARVIECPETGVCVLLPDGERSLLEREGRGAARWGADSVGYFVGIDFEIRPNGPGRARRLRLLPRRENPRELTFFPGPGVPR
jgi:hypothetical protein